MNNTHESRAGDWMLLASGRPFWPLDPDPDDIYIEDIAHALSRLCRFGGHSIKGHYSVAQHSVYVSQFCNPENALIGLLHDASEAYLVDVPKPIKIHLPDYIVIETKLERCIAKRFGFSSRYPYSSDIKLADMMVCATEKRDIMPPYPDKPNLIDRTTEADPYPPDVLTINPWPAMKAESIFLQRFKLLYGDL